MIQGRTPEITIKFNSLPDLPTEGKKVTLEILSENNLKIKAELNRKTLKKQVAKMEEYSNWIGALSGKIKSIAPGGIVELEGAGLQVFEVKAKETVAQSDSELVAPSENKPGASAPKVEAKVSSSKAIDSEEEKITNLLNKSRRIGGKNEDRETRQPVRARE